MITPDGMFQWVRDGAKRAYDWFAKKPGPNIPSGLVKNAIEQSKVYSPESIRNLGTLAATVRTATDRAVLTEYITQLVHNKILSDPDQEKTDNLLQEIAKLFTSDDPLDPAVLVDDTLRFVVADAIAKSTPTEICRKIASFNLKLEDRVKIAKTCLENQGQYGVIFYFKNFDIDDPAQRIELAGICANRATRLFPTHFENFEIADSKASFELASLCALVESDLPMYIQQFALSNDDLQKIVFSCAEHQGGLTAEHIKKFNIQDPALLIAIAKVCARNDGKGLAHFIAEFGITDKEALKEIACIAVKQSGAASQYITNFGLKDTELLTRLAKLCAADAGRDTAKNIGNFGITDKQTLIDIAKICAANTGNMAAFLENFGITDPLVLLEIARRGAASDGAVAEHINTFGFTDQNILVDLAKICARVQPMKVGQYIANFGIKDESARREIALLSAREGGDLAMQYLDNFGLTDESTKLQFFINAFIDSHADIPGCPRKRVVESLPDRATLKSPEAWDLLYFAQELRGKSPEESKRMFEMRFGAKYRNELADIMRSEIPNEEMMCFVGCLLALRQAHSSWTQENGLIRSLVTLERADLKEKLTKLLLTVARDENVFAATEKWNQKGSWKPLARLVYMELESQGINQDLLEKIRQTTEKNKNFDLYTMHDPLLELLLSISVWEVTSDEKNRLLQKLFQDISLTNIQAINSVFLFKEPEKLLENKKPQEILEALFQERLALSEVAGIREQYAKTFGSSRNPTAIHIYAAKLASINDTKSLASLKDVIISVMDGTFRQKRYSQETSPHMATLESYSPELVAKWQESLAIKSDTKSTQISAKEWLGRAKEHLTIEVPYVTRYLAGDQKVKEELQNALKDPAFRVKQGEFSPLRFQVTLIEYADSEVRPIAERTALLSRLVKSVEQINQLEFLKDLQEELKVVSQLVEAPKVFDSDDPYDLLLSGTEVYGSCQAVSGDPHLNRGLLGYLLNGWNRVLKVSTEQNGPFIARCKLQLLWDGEKPVLFMEKIYSKGPLSDRDKAALFSAARQKADALQLPLLCEDRITPNYKKPLHALGGLAAYEYSDGAGPAKTWANGRYTIFDTRLL
ncbi:MAG: hypothetical protein JSR37_09010 [Verrucomicrobia bacterium]|nr:hypothetical protein [Verrucomicrobiota bacterium]MBS0637824.1 hypothetical protein [Verrucomicrobiota bacterium]